MTFWEQFGWIVLLIVGVPVAAVMTAFAVVVAVTTCAAIVMLVSAVLEDRAVKKQLEERKGR